MINYQKTAYFFLILQIIFLAISPNFALGEDNRNLLLIGLMSVSPILIIAFNKYHKTDVWMSVIIVSIIVIPFLNHPQSIRWSTILYSCMFGFSFIAYTRLLSKSKLLPIKYLKILKILIILYAVTLLIQQLCVLLGLPIFNISNYNKETPWKLNSLAAEPSHSARIVALLMYSYIVIKELLLNRTYILKKDFKHDKWVWFAFIWTMTTMGSATAFFFLPIILLKFLKRRSIITLIIISTAVFSLMNYLGVDAFDRTFKVATALTTLDINTIIVADHSGSLRIVPFLILIPMLSIFTLNGWYGHGVDYVSTFLSDFIPGVPDGISGGGFLQFWMEYGFFCFIIFTFGSIRYLIKKNDKLSIIFWFMLIFVLGMNNQITWLCFVLLFTNKHFLNLKLIK